MKIVKIIILILILKGVVLATPFSIKSLKNNNINIVAFVTSWCPVCQKLNNHLLKLSNKDSEIFVTLLFVDEKIPNNLQRTNNLKLFSIPFLEAKKFGVDKSVPYILIFDKKREIVKKYHTFNRILIDKLVNNLKNNLYENGTLPPEKRIDLWQKNRF